MANSSHILEQVLKSPPSSKGHITYQWLLPNLKGLDNFFATFDGAHPSSEKEPSSQQFDAGPALNTSSSDPNAMPSTLSAEEAMSKNSGSQSSPKSFDAGPSLNTSTQDANEMPSSMSGVDAMEKGSRSSSSKLDSAKFDQGPALNTSSFDANAMPSSTSGVDAMSDVGVDSSAVARHEVSLFMAATETFSQRNTNCSIPESLSRFRDLISKAQDRNFTVRAYISVALGCPYEGADVDPHRVAEICTELLEMGADEISVADTTGMGTPPRTRALLKTLAAAGIKNEDLALHFHDTYGQALVNTLVGLEHGVSVFDSAVGGLGGCPFSPGATGNVATEDLVNFLEGLGVKTGVNLDEVARIGDWISKEIGRNNESRAGRATVAKL